MIIDMLASREMVENLPNGFARHYIETVPVQVRWPGGYPKTPEGHEPRPGKGAFVLCDPQWCDIPAALANPTATGAGGGRE